MTSIHDDLNDTTPNKKRKRSTLDNYISSTPNFTTKDSRDFVFDNPGLDLCIASPKNLNKIKKNEYNAADSCMEVKSISDLVMKDTFEVIRKPPKKKKRTHDFEENCFVNKGLNLNVLEKNPLNPFEVKRLNESNESSHCFINSGLNIRGPESNINPFEVPREKSTENMYVENAGVDNLGLELQPTLSIGLPFTPTINRRINFKNLSPTSLQTPSTMLAKSLVFSPDENKSISIKRNSKLSVITEEPLDIDKELDYYQLELENSINEAKTRKDKSYRSLMDNKHISNLALKLKNLKDDHEMDETDDKSATFIIEIKTEEMHVQTTKEIIEPATDAKDKNDISEVEEVEGVQYEEVSEENDSRFDDDLDFKNPAPFKRAFRRSMRVKDQQQEKPEKENISHSHNFMKDIRKSIRKLINHPKDNDNKPKTQSNESHGLFSTIRQSFRRKAKIAEGNNNNLDHNKSIVDESVKRQVFRQPEADAEGNIRKSRRQKKIYF